MSIKIALAGNPNCGKTTLFNQLTGSSQYVGNWPGVTVEKKEGKLKGHKDVIIQDLPGIYSLSPYTLEEVVARGYLVNERPDAILNIVDGTNIERNLYLTTQLLELGIPVVIAINMMDIVRKNGDKINVKKLSETLGCEIIEISADDSRVINIQYIVTDSKDEIEKAYAELKEGNSFFAIAKKYNSDGEYEYELRRGEMDSKFEEAAYALSTGEMSSIVEAEGKYYIIRCTSDNDKAKTEVNKSAILADKKLAAFNEKFEEYEAGKYVEWNDSEWKKLSVSSAVIYNVKFEDIFNTITIN